MFDLFFRDSVLATISRSLRDKLSSNQSTIAQENENLEEDMRKAQESTLMLKSVIIPLETEISQLKVQLKEAKDKIVELESLVNRNRKQISSFVVFILASSIDIIILLGRPRQSFNNSNNNGKFLSTRNLFFRF